MWRKYASLMKRKVKPDHWFRQAVKFGLSYRQALMFEHLGQSGILEKIWEK